LKKEEKNERRKIISTLNHHLTFARLCFRKTVDIFYQAIEKKFQREGHSIDEYPDFRRYIQSFNYGSTNLYYIFYNASSLSHSGFYRFKKSFSKFFVDDIEEYEDVVDVVVDRFWEIWAKRFHMRVFSPGIIHTEMIDSLEKLSEKIWKKFIVNNDRYFSSWKKISEVNAKHNPELTLERAKEIILSLTFFENFKLSNHVLEIYIYHVWKIIDLIIRLFPSLEEYYQVNFQKLQQLSPSLQHLFYSDISVEQFLFLTNNYFPTEICKIILDYDFLRPESSNIFFSRLLSFEKRQTKKLTF
jgi:hypothetical protein